MFVLTCPGRFLQTGDRKTKKKPISTPSGVWGQSDCSLTRKYHFDVLLFSSTSKLTTDEGPLGLGLGGKGKNSALSRLQCSSHRARTLAQVHRGNEIAIQKQRGIRNGPKMG